jgi:hypothetical protein
LAVPDLLDVFEGETGRPDGLPECNSFVEAIAVSVVGEVSADDPHDVLHGKLTDFDLVGGVGHVRRLHPHLISHKHYFKQSSFSLILQGKKVQKKPEIHSGLELFGAT